MVPDLTLEVIYFNQPTDFKMEFELCGSCNVRFLSACAKSRSEFLTALSKSVVRSRAIITVGSFNPLDGDFLPKIISKAAGYVLKPVDKAQLSIINSGEFSLPETAIPLVTAEGVLGGAVLENSDQTIIMLSDERALRHTLVSDLVCPYLKIFAGKRVCLTEAGVDAEHKNSKDAEVTLNPTESDFENVSSQAITEPKISDNTADDFQEILQIADNISKFNEPLDEVDKILHDIGVSIHLDNKENSAMPLSEDVNEAQAESNEHKPHSEDTIEHEAKEHKNYTVLEKPENAVSHFDLKELLADSDASREEKSKKICRRWLKIIISIILVIAVLLASYFGYDRFFEPMQTTSVYHNIRALYGKSWDGLPQDMLYKFGKLYQTNNDIFGWLNVPDTEINLPVVSSINKSELYYQTHLFDGSANSYGTLYTNSVSSSDGYSRNITVFSKESKREGMLSDIKKYLNSAHYETAPTLSFDTLYLENKWKVFSAFQVANNKSDEYVKGIFFDDAEFESYISDLKEISVIDTSIDVTTSDQLISLVCEGEGQSTVVVARRVRDNESPLVDITSSSEAETYLSSDTSTSSDVAAVAPPLQEISSSSKAQTSSKVKDKNKNNSSNTSSRYEQSGLASQTITVKPNSSKPASSSNISSADSSSSKETETSSDSEGVIDNLPILTVTNSFNSERVSGPANVIIAQILEAEMGSHYHIEALKAQAVAAYSWLLRNSAAVGKYPVVPMKTAGKRATTAANAVAGEVAVYDGKIAETVYYATSAGKTANSSDVWSAQLPYLVSVDSSVDVNASGYQTIRTYTSKQIAERANTLLGIDLTQIADKSKWFECTYDKNGVYVSKVKIGGVEQKGTYLRNNFFTDGLTGLRSSAYTIKYNETEDKFVFTVLGYGHGVGMSQTGADFYANSGMTYDAILKHYYTGISLGTYFAE